MRKNLLALTLIMSLCSFPGFAAEVEEGLPGLIASGFKTKPLAELRESADDYHTKLVAFFPSQGEVIAGRVHVVTDYPKAPGKTEVNYAPARSTVAETKNLIPFDTLVLSRHKEADGSSDLSRILSERWIPMGLSSHFIVPADGTIICWVNPITCKGQMAGKWNAHSVEVLVSTDAGQCISPVQEESIASIIRFANTYANAGGETVTHILSHGEARGSEHQGTIVNIDEVRTNVSAALGYAITNTNKEHEQAPFPPVAA